MGFSIKRKRAVIALSTVIIVFGVFWGLFFPKGEDNCNVAYIPLRGEILTYLPPEYFTDNGALAVDSISSEDVIGALFEAQYNDDIGAILISVDSLGGGLVAGQEIADAVEKIEKPVVVSVGSSALSAAYYSISPADIIFASQYSDIGSIAITMSYLENVEKNKKDGLSFVELTSGKFKESGNPDRELTFEEWQITQKQLKDLHKLMVQDIATKRNIPIEQLAKFADGSVLSGTEALSAGLIDKTGSIFDAIDWIQERIGRADVCWE